MLSAHVLDTLQADEADDPYLPLLTIDHADLPEPIRFVPNYTAIVSRGLTFLPFPFTFRRPGEGEQGRSTAAIVINNIDKRIVETVRVLTSPPTLLIEMIVASAPDDVEETLPAFRMFAVSGDRYALEGELVDSDDDNEPLCKWTYTPSLAPALFT